MGVFDGLFGKKNSEDKKEKKALPWISLVSEEQLKEVIEKSKQKPQLIFKHSTTCGISRMVLNMFTKNYGLENEDVDLYFLDLHNHRGVSNAVAKNLNIFHESPQLLIVKNGAVVAHASHGGINDLDLKTVV